MKKEKKNQKRFQKTTLSQVPVHVLEFRNFYDFHQTLHFKRL